MTAMKTSNGYPLTFDEVQYASGAHFREGVSDTHRGRRIAIETYPDTWPLVRHRGGAARYLVRPRSVHTLMAFLWWADAEADRGHGLGELILPYVPGSRQDRLMRLGGDALFTAKSVAKEINLRKFSSVVILDPHSDVTPALIERSVVYTPAELIRDYVTTKYAFIVSPDAGSEKRAGEVAKVMGLPLIHGWKTRDTTTGALTGFGVEDPPDKGLYGLVVDDICDGGGTFEGLAMAMKEKEMSADLWVTHGFFTKGTETLLQRFGRIYTTDSAWGYRSGVEEIPFGQRYLENGHL